MTEEYNARTLAYLGDAVLELLFRERLLQDARFKIADVHDAVVAYTSAKGQTKLLEAIEPQLNDAEKSIVKRGRNATLSRKPRPCSLSVQRRASALETLFGYLHMNEETTRIKTLLDVMISAIDPNEQI